MPPRLADEPDRLARGIEAQATLPEEVRARVAVAPLSSVTGALGALVAYPAEGEAVDDDFVALVREIAADIGPAVAVAEHHHAVKQSAVVDLTTGAYTNWFINQRFDEEIARSQRTRIPITVIIVGVLDFEVLQRRIGYEQADQLLRELADEYAGLMRVFDMVGMRSRSEFVILLPDTDIAAAATVIARIHQRSARVVERLGSSVSDTRIVTGAASFPDDGDRVPTITLAAEHRLNQNEILHRRMAETA